MIDYNGNEWDIDNCLKNGKQCACKNCKDQGCRDYNCGICSSCDEYWEQCTSKRDKELDLSNTKEVLEHLRKCFAGHIAICEGALNKGVMLTLKGEPVSETERQIRESRQEGRIDSYRTCLGYVSGLLEELKNEEQRVDG